MGDEVKLSATTAQACKVVMAGCVLQNIALDDNNVYEEEVIEALPQEERLPKFLLRP